MNELKLCLLTTILHVNQLFITSILVVFFSPNILLTKLFLKKVLNQAKNIVPRNNQFSTANFATYFIGV